MICLYLKNAFLNRYLNYKCLLINHQLMLRFIEIYLIIDFKVHESLFWFHSSIVIIFQLSALDNNEYTNYRNTLLLMLFDRWQHCRQMGDQARNIFNLSSLTDISTETFINEVYTLISNTSYLGSIIQQNSLIMVNEYYSSKK